ncbi:hypothetical protein [Hymenobacter terrenus]|uniref:hypothetical protein n=1 Tax=Hymenobacter terrenus TaxID=1629124 RepID=UPI000619CAB3|nr:hypothetical protein [Hymenobacter terrenus]
MPDATPPADSYTRQIQEKIALSTELHKLSSQEFDKQVVYIAGGGLALTLTFAKDIASVTNSFFVPLLLCTWLFFAGALLINLFSYRKATESHDASRSLHQHYLECHESLQPINQANCDTWSTMFHRGNAQVHRLNNWSFLSVAAGIGCFILFVLLNVVTMSKTPPTTPQASATKPDRASQPDSIRGIAAPSSLLTTPPPPSSQPATTSSTATKSAE